MNINLIKEDKLLTYKLPNEVIGNFWLTEIDSNGIEKNIICIEANEDGKWHLVSNNDYYVYQNNKKISNIVLEKNSCVPINYKYSYEGLVLFTSNTYENMKYYYCSDEIASGITIGRNTQYKICYSLNILENAIINIKLINDDIILSVDNLKFNIFVNEKKVLKNVKINYGDVIFIMGIKLLLLKIDGEYIIGITNPYNKVSTFLKQIDISNGEKNQIIEESKEEKEMNFYSKEDYFYRKPRYIYSIDKKNIQIDQPPAKSEKNEMPVILTIGPMLTMSMTSFMTLYTSINNINVGKSTYEESAPTLVIGIAMLLSFLFWPMLINIYQKRLDKKKEKERQQKYSKYLDNITANITEEKSKQEELMRKKYLSLKECENIIINKDDRLWERRIEDDDFLSVSLGYGELPLEMDISSSDEHFSMIDDNLIDKVNEIKNSKNFLNNVPIPFSFKDNYISAFIGDDIYKEKLLNNVILQLTAFHSYEDLKIVIFSTKENEKKYKDIKNVPHIWNNDKTFRYFASNEYEYKELIYQLDKIYNQRISSDNNITNENQLYGPLFLIIIDSIKSVRNLDLINNVINNKNYVGFSIIILNDRISNIPDQCHMFIELEEEISKISKNISNSQIQNFKIDMQEYNLIKCVKSLSNIPIEITSKNEGIIPKKVGFLEMYNVSKIEQFNSKQRWEENVPILNMSVPVGIGTNGEKITLDLHEKYHGPHGLIAGMTGSGKSEFIITYILSLALNYHPDEVQFILIDYKGGGLAGAFENQNIGIKLPHLVGVITNLDKNEINRSLVSIESELKRRQALFNKAREKSEESTIDIYKYQKMYRNHIVDEPISHLFIIADEFAELKQQQPEFMQQLISTARIGRSLGVHLILATQKPSGVVDSQIWSNTRFRVCLRVQETGDSSEVIKKPDAAYLTQTGRFYLQVGFNEIFVLGQAAWAGGKYLPSDEIKKELDTSIDFVDNIGYKYKSIQTKITEKIEAKYGEELINVVKYLSNIAKMDNINPKQLWLTKLPEFIYVNDLIKKYNYKKEDYILNLIIGEYDVPSMQEQRLLTMPFSKNGNALIYGITGSGKENLITTLIYSSMVLYSPNEVNFYILDFGSESLRYFDNCPFVGDIIYSEENDKLSNLFKMIKNEIENRKELFSNYNGNYIDYCKNSGNILPNIVVIINNYESFSELYDDYEDALNAYTRESVRYGIYFVITVNTPNGLRYKIRQNFNQVFALQQNNDDDFGTILGNVHKATISKIFGRGMINTDGVYEFQTAYAFEKESIPSSIKAFNEQIKQKYNYIAKRVPILPETVRYSDCINEIKSNTDIAIGISKSELKPIIYNFTNDLINVITTQDISLVENIIQPFIYQYLNNKSFNTIIINAENLTFDDNIKNINNYFDGNFDSIFNSIKNYIDMCYNKYKESNYNKNIFQNNQKINCIIFGINSFKNKLNDDNKKLFDSLFTNARELDVINFILIDTIDKIKNIAYEPWFKDNVDLNNGIYLGEGLDDQITLNVSKRIPEMRDSVPYNFGFVIKKGIPIYVKFIEEYK